QMSFRMKRNGAGLASICVLACMALFTIISTSGLYFGSAQILRKMYPRDLTFHLVSDKQEIVDEVEKVINETALEYNANPHDFVKYRFLHSEAKKYRDKKMLTDEDFQGMTQDDIDILYNTCPTVDFYLIPISDYNSIMGTNLTVNKGEALILKLPSEPKDETYDVVTVLGEPQTSEIKFENGETVIRKWNKYDYLKGVGTVDDFVVTDGEHLNELSYADVNNFHYRYAFINDEDFETQYQRKLATKYSYYRVGSQIFHSLDEIDMNEFEPDTKVYCANEPVMFYYFGTNFDCSDDVMKTVIDEISAETYDFIGEHAVDEIDGKLYLEDTRKTYNSVCYYRSEVNALYSGLFFLGVLFCIVFVLAAVLIMYYKQVTEGFEDKSRFEILQKVGMTKAEIRSSINSQVLTLFFTPLLAAGVHIAFSFPLIVKLLKLFGNMDVGFLALVAVICFALYSAVYIFAYVLTSKSNYRIVAR
ncbi:MAG: ABC transporter permease, partial [Oscillospiraceae bacterium]